jgi:hypothetical protein
MKKERKFMGFLLSHWHCLLPILGIGVGVFFMREKPEKDKENELNKTEALPGQNNEE